MKERMEIIPSFNNFLIKPDPIEGTPECFRLGDSGSSETPGEKQFCLIPYKNPEENPVEYFLFSCKEQQCDLKAYTIKENRQLKLSCTFSKADYVERVKQLKEQIRLGNIYEINFCIQFVCEEAEIDPISVFLKLNKIGQAPYSSLVKIGDDYIISASPELFLKKEGSKLFTKPIKGTARRGNTAKEDEELKNQLYHSSKERTENVMAVDVARNDLSQLAKRGTVNVNKLYNIETFPTVHQMVSTVSCELKDGLSLQQILNATFPMASMTGAPKISAMNFIDKYENFERNFYSGAMGLIDEKGDFEFSVNIRSIFYNQKTKKVSLAVGSAITHLCDPGKEYEECLLKAEAMLKALNGKIISGD